MISTSIHRDETTPHLVAYVVPIDEITGNLNAKKFIGGTRNVLSEMQTNFAKTVSDLGLDRGVKIACKAQFNKKLLCNREYKY